MIPRLTSAIAALALAASATLLALALLRGPDRPDQIAPGRELYDRNCAPCHEVGGRIGPELTRDVLAGYGNAGALVRYIRFTMPYDDPGALPDDAYRKIAAYMLDTAELLPEDAFLDEETAEQLTF